MLNKGTVLKGRFKIIEMLARGGMGIVYRAIDLPLKIEVAVKELGEQHLIDERVCNAFKQEARLLGRLDHRALPAVGPLLSENGRLYLIMQYISGEDLCKQLQKRKESIEPKSKPKPFAIDTVLTWADELLDVLNYLHTQSEPIIHRDIKPANLKLTEEGHIILLDFGIAKELSSGTLVDAHTNHYSPIEQILEGMKTDARSDLYALSATLYCLITGEEPPDAMERRNAVSSGQPDPLQPPDKLNSQVPEGVANVLMRAMSINAKLRPSTAAQMRKELLNAHYCLTDDADQTPVAGDDSPIPGAGRPKILISLEQEEERPRKQQGRAPDQQAHRREKGHIPRDPRIPYPQTPSASYDTPRNWRDSVVEWRGNKFWLEVAIVALAVLAMVSVWIYKNNLESEAKKPPVNIASDTPHIRDNSSEPNANRLTPTIPFEPSTNKPNQEQPSSPPISEELHQNHAASSESLSKVTARIEPIVYSYSKDIWASGSLGDLPSYPNVSGLGFYNGLGWGAGLSWKGSHSVHSDKLQLVIDQLEFPGGGEKAVSDMFGFQSYWEDIRVGYYVELRGATFDDYSLCKHFFLLQTFLGDSPPDHKEKVIPILPILEDSGSLLKVAGEWHGFYEEQGKSIPFTMRLDQQGNVITGQAMDYDPRQKRRSTIYGWVLPHRITLLKRYFDRPYGVSLVSSEVTATDIQGQWQVLSYKGKWSAKWKKPLDGSVDDLAISPR